jgi:hypothetical protein
VIVIGAVAYKVNHPSLYIDDRVVLSAMCAIAGLTGLVAVARKEIPLYLSSIRGVQAVVIGYCWIIITWLFSIILLAGAILRVK